MYAGVQTPRCETCHTTVSSAEDDILMHQMHGSKLSCQVCHSVAYTNYSGGQVVVDESTGEPVYQIEGATLDFLIGRNPYRNYERPYQYVPVRHAPVGEDSFDFYGQNLLQNFDALETWMYTTPHNIQRNTPQTASCNNCHGNPDLFLTADKVAPEELDANQWVIIDSLPQPITSTQQIPPIR